MPNYLGQHFLKNSAVIAKIVAALDVRAGETIIEIGPGHGELTIPLAAAAAAKIGAKIVAIEKDEKMVDVLRAKIAAAKIENVEIVHGDILEFLKTYRGAFKLVGNIPYYLTGHLLRIVSELDATAKPQRAVLMIQQEVAERLAAAPPRMNRLAASVQFWAEPKIIARVPRTDFTPPPKVDSAVIQLITKTDFLKNGVDDGSSADNAERYYATVRALFAQPRKTILNNLAADLSMTATTKDKIMALLLNLEIDPKSRPQNLTIANIVQIAEIFFRLVD